MKKIIISTLAILFFSGCTKTTQDIDLASDIPVVQSFLLPGSTPEVSLSKVIYFINEESDTDNSISNAIVFLHSGSAKFLLSESEDSKGKYQYFGDDLLIEPLETYGISFEYNNEEVTSTTAVPAKPTGFKSSVYSIYLTRITADGGFGGMPNNSSIDLSWDDPDNEFHLVSVQYLEDTFDPVNELIEYDDPRSAANFTSLPVQNNTYSIRSRQFQFFGRYHIILMRITPEYASLYESLSQSSLDGLAEPESNIINGKGIFTAYHADTLQVKVIPL